MGKILPQRVGGSICVDHMRIGQGPREHFAHAPQEESSSAGTALICTEKLPGNGIIHETSLFHVHKYLRSGKQASRIDLRRDLE